MHGVVVESLEEYLSGTLKPAAQRQFEAHLGGCRACREEVASMREASLLFGSLRFDQAPEPAPGFFARVMEQVGARKATPSFAALFALDFAFGRRLAFASLMTLAVLGSFLVARESAYPAGPSPETIMAQEYSPLFDTASASDNMLITLTAYER